MVYSFTMSEDVDLLLSLDMHLYYFPESVFFSPP